MSNVTLLTEDLWATLAAESAGSTALVAAVAYVTNIDKLRFRVNDILVLDASPPAIRAGKTSALIVEHLLDHGVLLYSSANLHVKMYVFDNSVIVGSQNLSTNSRSALIECAILSRDSRIVVEARSWVERLASHSVRVDREFVSQAKAILVEPVADMPSQQQPSPPWLWYLAISPNALSKNMRAYFLALVIAQVGTLQAERTFRLWPGADFRQHENEGRLERVGDLYALTQRGVDYFLEPKKWPEADLLQLFLVAVRTGDGVALPLNDTKMHRMPGR